MVHFRLRYKCRLDLGCQAARHHILSKRWFSLRCVSVIVPYVTRPVILGHRLSPSLCLHLTNSNLFFAPFSPSGDFIRRRQGTKKERGGVWPGLRGGLRGSGSAAARSVGTDNEKGKLFRFLPLIPLLALGARLEGRGPYFKRQERARTKMKPRRDELLR